MSHKLRPTTLFSAILVVGITIELIVTAGQVIGGYNLSYVNGTTSGFIEFSLCLAICMPVLLHLLLKLLCRKKHRRWLRAGGVVVLVYMLCIAALSSWLIRGNTRVGITHRLPLINH